MNPKVNVTVKQEEPAIEVEVIAKAITSIDDATRKMMSGSLNRKAVLLLISNASGVGQGTIADVLDGMMSLKKKYLR